MIENHSMEGGIKYICSKRIEREINTYMYTPLIKLFLVPKWSSCLWYKVHVHLLLAINMFFFKFYPVYFFYLLTTATILTIQMLHTALQLLTNLRVYSNVHYLLYHNIKILQSRSGCRGMTRLLLSLYQRSLFVNWNFILDILF